jgi:hypothetical protein
MTYQDDPNFNRATKDDEPRCLSGGYQRRHLCFGS